MSTLPASASEAMDMVHAGLRYLAAADATAMAAETQAQCLQALEQANSIGTAARTSILAAFTSGQGYSADADYSPRAWLINRTRITSGAAAAHTAWVRRAAEHPEIAAALAAGEISESYARTICGWTGKLPRDSRPAADEILAGAARSGMDLADLAALAAEIYARSRPETPDQDQDGTFEDRSVKLETTFEGAGVLGGNLTPECAAIVGTVLDALSAPAGAEDTRSQPRRYHDALQDAMQRLVTAGLLPDRAGQPVKAWVHISLADLLRLDGSSALLEEWTSRVRAQWAGHRAKASAGGGDGGAWLDGDAAGAMTCDAAMAPIVTGEVDPAALEDLIRLCVRLDRLRRHHGASGGDGDGTGDTGAGGDGGQDPDSTRAWEALERAVIGKAVDLLSGPGGLASFLRRRQLGACLGGPSLPLDIGYSETIPAGIRHAVTLRDKHCQWAGRCHQPASACQVHHVRHRADGGQTSVRDCVLFCWFHHQVVIHRWGWTLVLNPDGTTTAWNPDKT
ncbi:MAG TPA: DUF222 domain-containing protein, partial [Streptosporangiaceae bacterium]|nr:DUF222 domain-containing protein [Streptosporangiaceae bacterium]